MVMPCDRENRGSDRGSEVCKIYVTTLKIYSKLRIFSGRYYCENKVVCRVKGKRIR